MTNREAMLEKLADLDTEQAKAVCRWLRRLRRNRLETPYDDMLPRSGPTFGSPGFETGLRPSSTTSGGDR